MARYTGPKVKISRRLGVNVFENEKGRKALEKRPYPPGEHGRSRRRQPLCACGVTSLMLPTSRPAAWSVRFAVSGPEPGPLS